MVDQNKDFNLSVTFDRGDDDPIGVVVNFVTIHKPCVDCGADVELFGIKDQFEEEFPRCLHCDWLYGRLGEKEW